MPIVLLKYGSWGAAGVLIGIAVAVWARPETAAGFVIIIVVGLLATIAARGLIQGVLAMLRQKSEKSGSDAEDEEKADAPKEVESVKPKGAEKEQDGRKT